MISLIGLYSLEIREKVLGPDNLDVASSLDRLAENYRIDGAINPCHWGCRQGTGADAQGPFRGKKSGIADGDFGKGV